MKDFSKANYNNGQPYIELVFFGDVTISQEVKTLWNNQKNTFGYLENAELRILNNNQDKDQSGYITELYNTNKEQLISSQSQIKLLQNRLESLNKYTRETAKFEQITKEISTQNNLITSVSFANELRSNFKKTDTIPVFRFKWKKDVKENVKKKELENLEKWLKVRLNIETLEVSEGID